MKLELKNWPVGNERSYLQLTNPGYIFYYGGEPIEVNVTSYRAETPDSLEKIKSETSNSLINRIKDNSFSRAKNAAVYIGVPVLVNTLAYLVASTPSYIPNTSSPPELFLGGNLLTAMGEIPFIKMKWRENKKAKEFTKTFLDTPIDKYSQRVDTKLQEIFKHIDNKSVPGNMFLGGDDEISSIKNLLHRLDKSLSPEAANVYKSILSTSKILK